MLEVLALSRNPIVKRVSFTLEPGETLALVGESGAGKSTVAKLVVGLLRPDDGQVLVDGAPLRRETRKDLQMVFQDQSGSLNPAHRIRDIIAEPLLLHTRLNRAQRRDRVLELLDRAGLPPELAGRRPGQLSGGQRQRVAIARAVACEPKYVICDEPVSSVDFAAQQRVLAGLVTGNGSGRLVIAHDLAMVRRIADRVAVMRAGELVETGPVAEIFGAPRHDYTRALLAATPSLQARRLG